MGRVAVIKIVGGDFQHGFQVLLQICQDGAGLPVTEIKGQLPPQTNLEGLYISWLVYFRGLKNTNREFNPGRDGWDIDPSVKTHSAFYEDVEACREMVEDLEKNFQQWLQQSENEGWLKIRERLIEELAKNPDSLRITIQAENRCLWKMPWHSWNLLSRYPEVGIGFSPLEFDPKPKSKREGSRVRVLAVLGNSDNIDLSADRTALEALPDADVVILEEPSATEVIQYLRDEGGWDIFCFAGHSESEENTGRIYINQTESLKVGEFKNALAEAIAGGLKLAIFNSCDGLGLARELASLQLPVAIVMKEPVPDIVAQSFLRNFLKEYAKGKSLYASVRRAGERLEEFKDLPGCTWLPIVCQNPAEMPPTWADLLNKPPLPSKGEGIETNEDRIVPSPFPPRLWWHGLSTILLASVVVTSLVMAVRSLAVFQTSELKAYDGMMRLRPNEGLDERLLIVKVTAEDYQKLQQYPLTDETVMRLLEKLNEYQPQIIGLNLFRDLPQDTGRPELGQYLKQHQNIIGVCYSGDRLNIPPIPPPPGLSQKRLGFSDLTGDFDNTVRRQLIGMSPNSPCNTNKSFSIQIVSDYLEREGVQPLLKRNSDRDLLLGEVVLKKMERDAGGYQLPPGEALGYQILINYRSDPEVARVVTLTDILNGSLDSQLPDLIEDRIVLIGNDARISADSHLTPYSAGWSPLREMPGVVLHGHIVSQLLSAVLDGRPLIWWWPQWGETLWVLTWSFMGGLLVWYCRHPLLLVFAGTASAGALYIVCFVLLLTGGWVTLIPTAIALVATGGSLLVYRSSQN